VSRNPSVTCCFLSFTREENATKFLERRREGRREGRGGRRRRKRERERTLHQSNSVNKGPFTPGVDGGRGVCGGEWEGLAVVGRRERSSPC